MRKLTIAVLLIGVTLTTLLLAMRPAPVSAPSEPAGLRQESGAVTPTPQAAATITASPAATPLPKPTPFSFAWIGDTQSYTAKDNDVFGAMTQWIADSQKEYNTVFTVHTGDIVYNPYEPYQWENGVDAFARLPKGMRVLTVAGNHDFLAAGDPNTPYLDNRPDTDYDQKRDFNKQGYAYYTTFSEGGVSFLVFSLSYGYELAAVDWVNSVCRQYADHFAILCLHTYVDEGGYSSVGKRLFENVVKPNPNIRLVLCGHARGAVYWPEQLDDDGDGKPDRIAHQMMFDTQEDIEKGVGFLRILRLHPEEDTIEVVTYSPVLDQYGYSCIGGDRFQGTELLKDAGFYDFLAQDASGSN